MLLSKNSAFTVIATFLVSLTTVQVTSAGEKARNRVFFDHRGMPRCIEDTFGSDGILIEWDLNDHYVPELWAHRLSEISASSPSDFNWSVNSVPKNCAYWQELLPAADRIPGFRFTATDVEVAEIEIPDSARESLEQLALGGSKFRTEKNAEAYLSSHPGFDYTVQTNRQLTHDYGAAFSSQVYKSWIESFAANQQFKASVLENLKDRQSPSSQSPSSEKIREFTELPQITFFIVPGITEVIDVNLPEIKKGPATHVYEDLKSLGAKVHAVATGPLDYVEDNVEIIKTDLRALLSSGQNVILMGMSKGMAESIQALGQLGENPGYDSFTGKVLGVINLSGLLRGTSYADFGHHNLLLQMLRSLNSVFGGDSYEYLRTAETLTTERLEPAFNQYTPLFPKRLLVLNITGIIPGNGVATDPYMGALQKAINREMMPQLGITDGNIEHPTTLFRPSEIDGQVYTMAFDSSHVLLDGFCSGFALSDPLVRKQMLKAILETFLDRMRSYRLP